MKFFSLSSLLILIPLAFAAPGDVTKRVDSLTSRQARCITPNPVTVSVAAGKIVEIGAMSHAANLQRLTVSFGLPNIPQVVFQGNGENVPMPIVGGSSTSVSVPAETVSYNMVFTFAFSTNGGSSFQVPTVLCPVTTPGSPVTTVNVVSEDASDNDDNDTIAEVSIIQL